MLLYKICNLLSSVVLNVWKRHRRYQWRHVLWPQAHTNTQRNTIRSTIRIRRTRSVLSYLGCLSWCSFSGIAIWAHQYTSKDMIWCRLHIQRISKACFSFIVDIYLSVFIGCYCVGVSLLYNCGILSTSYAFHMICWRLIVSMLVWA